ncbi:PAS domain S-box-containing protein/diguanylate cyclase (GGDEF) domain-containing protein [Geodermatophilus pulveris]|uniref:PAS domain S-box-containing protein/diguanylate cyclase (GGDEF) domain-containing protein n=1 Tax=Geodermatophilus pulveris TaxID=1564159 RepID=A0A239D7T1_9ACTN|nr:EAL domain-containing protein [Geodermatophilus pulveris]SNS28232.1 PAS domain S-box-containing protein/diguanylate cyclase (GGDEF) domain-containing protein [Geodermatophilus pulveris]
MAVLIVALLWGVGLVSLPAATALHLSNVGLTVFSLAAGAAAVVRARRHAGRVRLFWRRLGAASLAWGGGMAAWSWYESLRGLEVPFPSVADVGFLASPLLAGWALLTLPLAAPTRAGRVRTVLDGLVVASSLLLVSWMLVLDSIVQAGGDVTSQAISLAYPVSDIVLITTVVYTWMRARSRGAGLLVPLPLIGVGLVALAVADSGFVYLTTAGVYSSGNWIDLGWGAGFCLLLLAALRPGEDAGDVEMEEVVTRPLGNLLPYAAVGVALLTSSLEVLRGGTTDTVHFWLRTAIMVLLVARQILTLLENHSLTQDLERRVEARTAEVRASGERFAALVQHSSDLVTVVDRSGTVLYQSRSSEALLGFDADAMVGRLLTDFVVPAHAADLAAVLRGVAGDADRVQTVQSTWRHASGRECHMEITLTNLLANAAVGGLVLNTRDVTDRITLERQLTHQAFTDSLTDLPNRALFKDRLQHALTRGADSAPPMAVYFLDLDGFKAVNDTLGHSAGDDLLVEVAARLRTVVRPSDTVARFGGDEFAILVDDLPEGEDGTALAQRVCDAIAAPILLDGSEVHISASIGIAHREDPSIDAEQMLRNADLAMYQAKADAGGFAVFVPEMHEGLVARMRLEADLRKALTDDQFIVHYQPMVSMRTGEITGVEALVRWQHPERGLVPPNEFIPLAEATGLIRPLGLWVLRESCRQAVTWAAAGDSRRGLKLSVNVSARQLQQDDLVEQVAGILRETGLPAQRLTLEMTESVLLEKGEETLATLTALRDLGIRLAIDDFGTGYSSLSYLHSFPVDILKIDRSFVERLSTGGDTALISTILRLGQTMKLETVAEGIEHPQELLLLRRQGCTTGQGYHFSPPVPAARIEELLAEASPDGRRSVPAPRPATVPGEDALPGDGALALEAAAGRI